MDPLTASYSLPCAICPLGRLFSWEIFQSSISIPASVDFKVKILGRHKLKERLKAELSLNRSWNLKIAGCTSLLEIGSYTVDVVRGRSGKYWSVVFNAWLNINKTQFMEMTRRTLHLCVATTRVMKLSNLKKHWDGAGEMAPWLRSFVSLSKHWASIPSTHIMTPNQTLTPVPGNPTGTHGAHTCIRTKYSYAQNKIFEKHWEILFRVVTVVWNVWNISQQESMAACVPPLTHSLYKSHQKVLPGKLQGFCLFLFNSSAIWVLVTDPRLTCN